MRRGSCLAPCSKKMGSIQMLDVILPTTDGRCLVVPRHTEPERNLALLLHHLKLAPPAQPPPRICQAVADPSAILKM
jgi:hypothetical protein